MCRGTAASADCPYDNGTILMKGKMGFGTGIKLGLPIVVS